MTLSELTIPGKLIAIYKTCFNNKILVYTYEVGINMST